MEKRSVRTFDQYIYICFSAVSGLPRQMTRAGLTVPLKLLHHLIAPTCLFIAFDSIYYQNIYSDIRIDRICLAGLIASFGLIAEGVPTNNQRTKIRTLSSLRRLRQYPSYSPHRYGM